MKIPLSIVVDEKSGDVRVYYEDGGYMTMDTHTMYHMPLGQVVACITCHSVKSSLMLYGIVGKLSVTSLLKSTNWRKRKYEDSIRTLCIP